MPKKSASINLIKDQKGDLIERITNWALSMGRILVIVTELVALAAFLWRFGLDQQLIDLHTQIKQKQVIVDAFKKNELLYRNLQQRLDLASNFSSVGTQKIKIYKELLSFAGPDITFNKISYSNEQFSAEINVNSINSLTEFVNSIKKNSNIQGVSIDKIETKTSDAIIIVGITAHLKPLQSRYKDEL